MPPRNTHPAAAVPHIGDLWRWGPLRSRLIVAIFQDKDGTVLIRYRDEHNEVWDLERRSWVYWTRKATLVRRGTRASQLIPDNPVRGA